MNYVESKTIKELTKQQFRDMALPQGIGKECHGAKMELNPNNFGIINGNKYTINILDLEDKVILTKVDL